MNPKSYRTPPSGSTRVRCPVCHEAVYSRAGIHPQCAVRQSEPPKAKGKPPVPVDSAEQPTSGDDRTATTQAVGLPPTRH